MRTAIALMLISAAAGLLGCEEAVVESGNGSNEGPVGLMVLAPVYQETVTLTGLVTDNAGTPIPDVTVFIRYCTDGGPNQGVHVFEDLTSTEGTYRIDGVPVGELTIVAHKRRYLRFEDAIMFDVPGVFTLDIALQPAEGDGSGGS